MTGKPTKLRFKGSSKRKAAGVEDPQGKKKSLRVPKAGPKGSLFSLEEYDFIEADDPKVRARDEWMLSPGEVVPQTKRTPGEKFVKESQIHDQVAETIVETAPSETSLEPQLKDQYDISYEFGDSGSSWRMMKLKKLYSTAQETRKPPEIVALERYGNLLDFDIAREEQKELEDRKDPKHTPKYKPNGFFYHQREFGDSESVQIEPQQSESVVKPSDLNEMRAKVLRAKLQKSPLYPQLEKEYRKMQDHVSSQKTSVIYSATKESNELADMMREEKMTKSNKEFIKQSVKAIMKDSKFSVDLDEQDEKLSSLGENLKKGKLSATGDLSNLKQLNKGLEKCYLCPENNKPIPVVQQSDSFIVALAPHPAIVRNSMMVFPKSHISNSLEFDVEQRQEFKRIMICLSKFYYEKLHKKVIFYELNNDNDNHCSIMVIPLPLSIDDAVIFEYFQSAIIEESNDLEQQHKIIIDTRVKSYDNYISEEATFFHLWLNLEGGIGHIIEEDSWPRGDLFARRVIGGILKLDKFDVERRTRYYVGGGVTDKELALIKKDFEKYEW